jgi:prevent-host-death family protein
MPRTATQPAKPTARQPIEQLDRWKLEDAKARFSEVVRLAATDGPQLVTIRGKEAAVILAPGEYEQLLPKTKGHQPLLRFLKGLGLDKIEIERERDTGREVSL